MERDMEVNSFQIGDVVVGFDDIHYITGEITKKSETADGENTYLVASAEGSAAWVSDEDICLA